MESWGKYEWIKYIEARLVHGTFVYRAQFSNKAALFFASDVFRRKGHRVHIFFETQEGSMCTGVVISQDIDMVDITIGRNSNLETVLARMAAYQEVRIRGCGTTLNLVSDVIHVAIHNGWFVTHTDLGTLVKVVDDVKQRNTTLTVTMRKGSNEYTC